MTTGAARAHLLDERGVVPIGQACPGVLRPGRQERQPRAHREVGATLPDDEVGGEVAGAPGAAQRRGVRPELEEGVAQGLALGSGDGQGVVEVMHPILASARP